MSLFEIPVSLHATAPPGCGGEGEEKGADMLRVRVARLVLHTVGARYCPGAVPCARLQLKQQQVVLGGHMWTRHMSAATRLGSSSEQAASNSSSSISSNSSDASTASDDSDGSGRLRAQPHSQALSDELNHSPRQPLEPSSPLSTAEAAAAAADTTASDAEGELRDPSAAYGYSQVADDADDADTLATAYEALTPQQPPPHRRRAWEEPPTSATHNYSAWDHIESSASCVGNGLVAAPEFMYMLAVTLEMLLAQVLGDDSGNQSRALQRALAAGAPVAAVMPPQLVDQLLANTPPPPADQIRGVIEQLRIPHPDALREAAGLVLLARVSPALQEMIQEGASAEDDMDENSSQEEFVCDADGLMSRYVGVWAVVSRGLKGGGSERASVCKHVRVTLTLCVCSHRSLRLVTLDHADIVLPDAGVTGKGGKRAYHHTGLRELVDACLESCGESMQWLPPQATAPTPVHVAALLLQRRAQRSAVSGPVPASLTNRVLVGMLRLGHHGLAWSLFAKVGVVCGCVSAAWYRVGEACERVACAVCRPASGHCALSYTLPCVRLCASCVRVCVCASDGE